jgi:methionyl-tRNA formyltransferase
MLGAPLRGCLNIHASLLPRWRGASPIQAAILAGDAQSGVTIMRMEEGLDTGPMLLAEATPLGPRETTATLHDRLAEIGARLILRALAENPAGTPQPEAGVTYAPKLAKTDAPLDWRLPATTLERRVRAQNPWPGTSFPLGAETIRVLDAIAEPGAGKPGEVLDASPRIACGEGALRLLRLQRPGRAALDAAAFLRGLPLPPGSVLG